MWSIKGFFSVDELTAEKVMLAAHTDGTRVFCFPSHIASKDHFFHGMRATFPLDPHCMDITAGTRWPIPCGPDWTNCRNRIS